jgi:hypothetical protein
VTAPLRLYSHRDALAPGAPAVDLLRPFWPEFLDDADRETGRLARYAAIARELFTITDSADDADALLLPADWKYYVRGGVVAAARTLRAAGRAPMLVFCHSDARYPVTLDDAVVYATALYHSTRRFHEHAMPFTLADLPVMLGRDVTYPAPAAEPAIAFCGNAAYGWRELARHLGRRVLRRGDWDGVNELRVRHRVLQTLRGDARVRCEFVVRRGHLGGDSGLDRRAIRKAYADNMLSAPYALCMRGAGNYSNRLYEAFAFGRIPVIVDTDCVYPFVDEIPWADCAVAVPYHALATLGDRLVAFHARNRDRVVEIQKANRELWNRYFEPAGFFTEIANRWRRVQ